MEEAALLEMLITLAVEPAIWSTQLKTINQTVSKPKVKGVSYIYYVEASCNIFVCSFCTILLKMLFVLHIHVKAPSHISENLLHLIAKKSFVSLFYCFTPQSTAMVMSGH